MQNFAVRLLSVLLTGGYPVDDIDVDHNEGRPRTFQPVRILHSKTMIILETIRCTGSQ